MILGLCNYQEIDSYRYSVWSKSSHSKLNIYNSSVAGLDTKCNFNARNGHACTYNSDDESHDFANDSDEVFAKMAYYHVTEHKR